MPEKDGSEDKKSTKSVVNKKQKQFMNQEEQLDLSSVAESFGGRIVGEPVELDEEPISMTLGGIALWKILAGLAGAGAIYQGGKLIDQELTRRKEDAFVKDWAKGDTKKNQAVVPGSQSGTQDLTKAKTQDIAKAETLTNVGAKTETGKKRLPKPFKMRLPKVPGTPHNVGRRVNPQ